MNGLGEAYPKRRIPISLVNETSKYLKLKKGNVIARIEAIDPDIYVNEVVSVIKPITEESENLRLEILKNLQKQLIKETHKVV